MPSILSTHPTAASIWHPTKNGARTPTNTTRGQHLKIWILMQCKHEGCNCPHEYEVVPSNFFRKDGTIAKCGHCCLAHHCKHKMIAHTHPEIAAELHPKKNGEVTAESIPSYSNQELCFLCPKKFECGCPHEYKSIVSNRTRHGNGCPFCGDSPKNVCVHRSIVHTHPEIAAQWNPTKNGGLTPTEFSHGSNVDIWWLCPIKCEHGCLHEWRARINTRCGRKHGCPYCAPTHKKVCIHNSIVTTEPQVAAEWDYVKNVGLDPTTIPRSSEIEAYFTCLNGHSYCATVGNRCRGGTGCPTCKHKTQKFLYEFLKSHYPDTENEFRLEATGMRRFDFCIPSLHTIIELDGAHHFFQVANWQSADETRTIDIDKTRAALAAGFNVIRISQEDVYASSFRGDSSWTTESMLAAINSVSEMRVQYISRDPELYREHVDALALQPPLL